MKKIAVIFMFFLLPGTLAHGIDVRQDTTVFGYEKEEFGPKSKAMTFTLFTGGYFHGLNQSFPGFVSKFSNIWRSGLRIGYNFNENFEIDSHLAYTKTVDNGFDLKVYDYGLNGLLHWLVTPHFVPYATFGGGAIQFREPLIFDFTRFQVTYGAGFKLFPFKNLAFAPEFAAITSFDPLHTAFTASLNMTYYLRTKKPVFDRDGDGIVDDLDKCPDQPETYNGVEDTDGCPEILDRDKDGIPDDQDKCPDQPETVNGIDDTDGCPEVIVLDRDKDGIPDDKDQCPDQPETINGFLDEDGCPENPQDLDGDGILNESDKCPKDPENKNGYMDEDGCPEDPHDWDGDGIVNDKDQCPKEPETKNGYMDEDGCPEDPNDTDSDGIVNEKDKCPIQPETFNNFEDTDGCPDQVPNDSDGDGVTDDKDLCPGPKEIYNQYKDDDGCPDHELDEFSGRIEGIFFETNQATIKRESYPKLNKAAEVLGRYPILNFVIEGHTDITGSKEYNMKLSEKRAQSVYEYLRYRGISPERMAIEAYGPTKPIADNKTAEGRSKNRRIEFRILNLEAAKAEAEEAKRRAR